MNLRTLAVTTALVCISAPAWALTNKNNGHNNQIVDGGPGAQANQKQHQTATGGAGGAGGLGGAGGAGGRGGSASGGTAAGGTASINGSYGGSVNTSQAPSVFVSPPAAGGQCGIVGFGVGGSGLGGGGGFGPSWESTNCAARINAEILIGLGYKEQAVALLRSVYPNVDAAFAAAPVSQSPIVAKPEYCAAGRGWSEKQLAARYSECRS